MSVHCDGCDDEFSTDVEKSATVSVQGGKPDRDLNYCPRCWHIAEQRLAFHSYILNLQKKS